MTGTVSIGINGALAGPVQLYTWGNYSNGKSKLLTGEGVVYQIVPDPDTFQAVNPGDGSLYPLAAPPETMELSVTGLLTAVDPSACSWFNGASGTASSPDWSMTGAYLVTATYSGLTTPPVYVAVASAPGVFNANSNPTGACGPSSTN
ncbi:MAG: hypothetical protein ABSB87_10545 [Terriglobales bacterium]